ncbi:hypothetical protein EWB00_004703 [Schistosoma japonicum]|uniref:Uncharacterized protein n=1 Tax=Schistosoma japonicum TaxID=6182 RepID=A0A4Z2D4C7_SCHJA|nr:hypothetical protein EWB00_004703 [Schistosoma japonicum]
MNNFKAIETLNDPLSLLYAANHYYQQYNQNTELGYNSTVEMNTSDSNNHNSIIQHYQMVPKWLCNNTVDSGSE